LRGAAQVSTGCTLARSESCMRSMIERRRYTSSTSRSSPDPGRPGTGVYRLRAGGLNRRRDIADRYRGCRYRVRGPLNVVRTVRELEGAGVAGIVLEDQTTPKRCGRFAGKQVVAPEEMLRKVRAAVAARGDDELVLIARTDALAVEGFEPAVERARAYLAAGADVIFVEAGSSDEQIAAIPEAVGAACMINAPAATAAHDHGSFPGCDAGRDGRGAGRSGREGGASRGAGGPAAGT
jgi:hypothetical protein